MQKHLINNKTEREVYLKSTSEEKESLMKGI